MINEPEIISMDNPSSDRPFDLPFTVKDTALICEPEGPVKDKIIAKLTHMGYQVYIASSPGEAIKGMKFHTYNLLLVNEDFVLPACADNEVTVYIASLPMNIRRRMFVVLLSSGHLANDRLTAFYKSVNIIIDPEKIDDLEAILKAALEENDLRYHVFREVSIKVGRT